MYVLLEYLTYVAVVVILAGVLFFASALFVITAKGAQRISETSRKIAAYTLNTIRQELHVNPPSRATEHS